MKTVELRAIMKLEDGTDMVQTGIYVFDSATLKSICELMENGIKGHKVTSVEFDLWDVEEPKEKEENLISIDELKKVYNHEPIEATKAFVTSEKAWENLGKLDLRQKNNNEEQSGVDKHD